VEWRELTLTRAVEGYAKVAPPLEEVLRDAVGGTAREPLPTVVWIYDLEDEKGNAALETKIFQDEKVGLTLKRFHCLKANLDSLPDGHTARKLKRRTPIFFFYDPAGQPVAALEGKRAESRSRFSKEMEELWKASFEMRHRDYLGKMGDILDDIDKLETKKALLEAKIARAAGNARKLAKLDREKQQLDKQEKKILEAEQEVHDACRAREAFRPEAAQK
jgi:DNA repair exonuclease SbcCD ATPase subunit